MKTSAGLQDSSTTDESSTEKVEADLDLSELIQRRTVLGAVAALAGLSQTAGAEAPDASAVIKDRSVTDDGTYSVTDCGSVHGGLNNVHVTPT